MNAEDLFGLPRKRKVTKTKVDLFWCWRRGMIGLIIPAKTGVFFSNQTGGVMCNHPEIEGVFVPLEGEVWDEKKGERIRLEEKRFWHGNSEELRYEEVIKVFGLPLKPFPLQLEEAWVLCKVTNLRQNSDDWKWLCGQPISFWKSLKGKQVLLTFQNSD